MKKMLLIAAITASLLPLAAKADVVLMVDLSVLNRAIVTATSGLSAATRTGSTTTGFYFENLFNSSTTGAVTAAGVGNISTFLQAPDNSPSGFRFSSTDPGFNIFSYSAVATSGFTAGVQAFQGSATFTLTPAAYNLALAAAGTSVSRNVYFPADDFSDLGAATVIGTWTAVVPEPSTVAFCVVGVGGLLVAKLRRKK